MPEMSAVGIIAIWGSLALVSALFGALLAANRERNYSAWGFWSLLFPPALLLLLFLPRIKVVEQRVREERHHDED